MSSDVYSHLLGPFIKENVIENLLGKLNGLEHKSLRD